MSAIEIIKNEMAVLRTSKVGALINVEDYDQFKTVIATYSEANIADIFASAEKLIAQNVAIGTDAKAIIDTQGKKLKIANENLRSFLTQYMVEENIEKLEGKESKSITLQKAKEIEGFINKKQIKIKNKFVDVDTLSKEDLISLLEDVGFKTRVETLKTKSIKDASIIVRK